MLAMARHLPALIRPRVPGNGRRNVCKAKELRGKTLGIIGLGRIGTEVVTRAFGFAMKGRRDRPLPLACPSSRTRRSTVSLPELYMASPTTYPYISP